MVEAAGEGELIIQCDTAIASTNTTVTANGAITVGSANNGTQEPKLTKSEAEFIPLLDACGGC
jgi:hypothetical protein